MAEQQLAAAIAAHRAGLHSRAETLYQQAIANAPNDAQAHYLLGALYYEMKSFDRARDFLERAVVLRSDFPSAHEILGLTYFLKGDHVQALPHLKAAAVVSQPSPETLTNYGRVLRELGKPNEAADVLKAAVARYPQHAPAFAALGRALLDLRDDEGAGAAFDACLSRDSNNHEALLFLGSLKFRQGELVAAEVALRRLNSVDFSDAVAKNLLGSVLQAQGRLEEAEELVREAFKLAPENPDIVMNLGLVLGDSGRTQDAIALHRRAVAMKPEMAEGWNNLGFALQHAGEWDEALAAYDRALTLKPDFHGASTNKAFTLLTMGRLKEAWPLYARRFDQKIQASKRREFPYPVWDGKANPNLRLLLWTDQGLGDEVLYLSMLREAMARVGHCILACTAKMTPLFQRSFPEATVVPHMRPANTNVAPLKPDVQLPLIELGEFLLPSVETIPAHHGYLKADPDARALLRGKYEAVARGKRIVGISWKSESPRTGRFKTLPLAQWAPILKTPDAVFVALQYGDVAVEIDQTKREIGVGIVHDPEIDASNSPDQSAAQIAAMDLVITVSNTTAHFAGAMNVPVWTLAPRGPGLLWYWFTDREDSPWYPSMRLFRQSRAGDWSNVVAQVAHRLNVEADA